jgi:hypothetical protein
MRAALSDPALLGNVLAGESWQPWRVLLIAAIGRQPKGVRLRGRLLRRPWTLDSMSNKQTTTDELLRNALAEFAVVALSESATMR